MTKVGNRPAMNVLVWRESKPEISQSRTLHILRPHTMSIGQGYKEDASNLEINIFIKNKRN
jgi:hypothetical protein